MLIKRCFSDTLFSKNIKKKIIAASGFKNMCATYGEGSLSERTCRKWFTRFREGNFNLSDERCPGLPPDCNEETIRVPLSKNARQSTSELAEALGIPKSMVHYNLKKIEVVNRYDVWVPYILTEKHLLTRVTARVSLPARHKELSFMNRIVTGDEKWISYNNVLRKRIW